MINLVTKPALIAAAVAVVALTGALGLQTYRIQGLKADVAQGEADFAKYRTNAVEAALKVTQERDDERKKREADKQESINAALALYAAAELDARTARTAGEQLRAQLAAARARRCEVNRDPDTVLAGPSPGAPPDLLDVVQLRLDAAADGIAEFADRAAISGDACRAQYNSLKSKE